MIPLRQERHVSEHVKAHCAPLERGVNWKHEAINIVLLRSTSLRNRARTDFYCKALSQTYFWAHMNLSYVTTKKDWDRVVMALSSQRLSNNYNYDPYENINRCLDSDIFLFIM